MNNALTTIKKETDFVDVINGIYESMNPATREVYTGAINKFLEFAGIGINKIAGITINDIKKYISHLESIGLSYNTINLRINSLRSLFRKLNVVCGIKNIFTAMKDLNISVSFQTERTVKRELTLTAVEVNELINTLHGRGMKNNKIINEKHYRNYLVIKLLSQSGLRISELINIKYSDMKAVNDKHYQVRIKGKGKRQREIYIESDYYNELKTYNPNQSGYVFLTVPFKFNSSGQRKQINRRSLYIEIRQAGKEILNKHISPHSFRHFFAHEYINNRRKPTESVSRYLGHSSTSITLDMYCHSELTPDDLFELVA